MIGIHKKNLLPVLAASALVLAAALPASAQIETVKDEARGITFKAPREWVSIPLSPTDTLVIYKFQANRPDRARKHYISNTASLDVLFFPIQGATTGEEPEAAKGPESDVERIQAAKREMADSYETYMDVYFKNYEREKPRKKKIRGIPVTYHELVGGNRIINGEPFLYRVKSAVFHTDDGEFVMQFSCMEEHYKKRHKKDFDSSLQTFKLIEKKTVVEDRSQLSANERYIQEQIDKLPRDWYHFRSSNGNYMIFSNAEKTFAREVEENLEAVHAALEELYPGETRIDWIPIVRVCKTKDEYHGYGGPGGSAGYWSDVTKEFVFYDDVARGEKNSIVVLKHEAFHQYIHFYLGCAPSTWFDEGHADYFSGGRLIGKRIDIKHNQWRRGTIQSAVVNKSYVPIKQLVHMTKNEYYSKARLCYAQGWSFVYFLLQGKKEGARMKKEWEQIPRTYLKHLREAFAELEAKNPDKVADKYEVNRELSPEAVKIALERTFEGWTDKDWKELEDAWAEFTG